MYGGRWMHRARVALVGLVGLVLSLGAWSVAVALEAESAKDGETLKVLLVTGGHDYDQPAFHALFGSFPGIECVHQDHKGDVKPLETIASPAIQEYDVIVCYDMWQPITDAQKIAYAKVIRDGKGIVILHHAFANFNEWPEYRRILGGRYFLGKHRDDGVEKPSSTYQHDVVLPVQVADPDHYITRGLKDYETHDEAYGGFAVDPGAHVLLRAKHPASGPVVAWTKPYGKGRVVAIQLGHDAKAWKEEFKTLVSRAIRYAARRTPDDLAMKPLFDGKTLGGWKAEGNARFAVEDGILVGRQGPEGAAGDLFTSAEYGDFECELTWAMDWPGNSGLWFRYRSPGEAYQADILEYKNPLCWSGSLYCPGKMFIALNEDPTTVNRDGWNVFRIRCVKDRLQIELNGHDVADVREASFARGRFGFQVHAGAAFETMAIRVADLRVRSLEGGH